MRLSLGEIAAAVRGHCDDRDTAVTGVSIDSRTLEQGQLYVALRGQRFDGHDFIPAARDRGAAAAMVTRPCPGSLPQVEVNDTRESLGRLAAHWRARFAIPVVGITGSNGKTTVKEMIAAILRRRGPTLATEGNKNNDIGVPLTLLRLDAAHRHAVIEMGANHPGEIAVLSALAQPNVAVVTNAAAAHLEGFRSTEGVAHAKGEMFSGLRAGGIAVINADDQYFGLWRSMAGDREWISFGIENEAVVSARRIEQRDGGVSFELHAPEGVCEVALNLYGRHNVRNALAAAAAALAAGAGIDDVRAGLESMVSVRGRMGVTAGQHGLRLIDDTYNANPASLNAALDALQGLPGEKVVVFGDMFELGPEAPAMHAEAGRRMRAAGVARLYAVGELSRAAVQAFGAGAAHFTDRGSLLAALVGESPLWGPATVLIKGSRGMGMEAVTAALRDGVAGNTQSDGAATPAGRARR